MHAVDENQSGCSCFTVEEDGPSARCISVMGGISQQRTNCWKKHARKNCLLYVDNSFLTGYCALQSPGQHHSGATTGDDRRAI